MLILLEETLEHCIAALHLVRNFCSGQVGISVYHECPLDCRIVKIASSCYGISKTGRHD